MINGVIIYFAGTIVLFLMNRFNLLGFAYLTMFFLVNPLMIYVYDYIINPLRLGKNFDSYYFASVMCFLVETQIWDWIRFMPKNNGDFFFSSFFGISLTAAFILQMLLAILLRRKKASKHYAIPLLLILPLMSYGLLTLVMFAVSNMAP